MSTKPAVVKCSGFICSILLGIILLGVVYASVAARVLMSPVPLPHDCDGFTPPGGSSPMCCAYGYVYSTGAPVSGAAIHVASAYGAYDTTTEDGSASSLPYYGIDLTLDELLVSPGDTITVTATYAGQTSATVYQVAADGQQVDVVLAPDYADWWDLAYSYRRPLTITTGVPLGTGYLLKVDGWDLETLVSAGQARADHNDMRVARRLGDGSWQEVSRIYYSGWDLEFQLAAPLDPGTDTSYYLYYGNPDAGTPPTFSLPQGWWVDMYHDKWWDDYGGTWDFTEAMDFDDVCETPLDHDGRLGTTVDESDRFRGRVYIPSSGYWTFRLYTNDGYRVEIAGSEIARFDGYDGSNRWVDAGSMYLHAGWQRLELRNMWVSCGAWKLAMEGPGFANQIVPAAYFQQIWDFKKGIVPGPEESILERYPPIATIHYVKPHPATQGQDIVVSSGSAVDNDEGGASITQYVWRSDLNGVLSSQRAFTLPAADLDLGIHTIYFKVKDDEGSWSDELSTTLNVLAASGTAPEAVFSVSPTAGYTDTVFAVDASDSYDNEDPLSALEVRWDWEDDGVYNTAWQTQKTLTHSYPAAGLYTMRLQVRDTDSMESSTTHDVTVQEPVSETPWLFILYLDGDNNLYGWLQRAVQALENAPPNAELTTIVLLDGPGNGDTWRYHVQPDGDYVEGVNRWHEGELNMGDPQTLQDFVLWARETYPAEHTYLALADHGRGTSGIAWDDTSGSGEFITVAELGTALREITQEGAAPLDVVHYDACLMGMVENGYQLRDYADFMVTSENLGWSTFAYPQYAALATATTAPRALATEVAGAYFDSVSGYPSTIAAWDLGQVTPLLDAVTSLATALQTDLDANQYHIQNTRTATQKFDSQDYFTLDEQDEYIDLYDFARLVKQNVPGTAVKSAAQTVMNAVDAFVVAEHHASGRYKNHYLDLDDAHGVSIYFPAAPGGWDYSRYLAHVFDFTIDSEWDEFLLSYFGITGIVPTVPVDPGVPPVLEVCYRVYLPLVLR